MDNSNDNEELELDELEIEAFAATSQERKPRAKVYLIRVDKVIYRVNQPEMTGRAILTLAGKIPADAYRLRQKLRNGEMHTIEARRESRLPCAGARIALDKHRPRCAQLLVLMPC